MKDYERKVLDAEDKILTLEKELFAEVRKFAAAHAQRIRSTAAAVAEIDVTVALAQVAAIGIAVTIVTLGIPIVRHLMQFDERSQAANVPLFIPQAMVPIGLTLLAIGALARLAMMFIPRDESTAVTKP